MKKKSASQSAFFNLRRLNWSVCHPVLAPVWRCLPRIHSGAAPLLLRRENKAKPASRHLNTLLNLKVFPAGFDCSKVHQLGIDKQDNMLAETHHDCLRLHKSGSEEGSEVGSASAATRSPNGCEACCRALVYRQR